MQTLREIAGWLFGVVMEALGETAGELIGIAIVGLLMLAGTLPIYFLLKKLSGRKTTFKEDLVEAVTWQPGKVQPSPMVRQLDQVGRGVETFYNYFLWFVLALGTVFIVWFFHGIRQDVNRPFLHMYFGIVYLFLLAWVLGTQWSSRRRRQAKSSGDDGEWAISAAPETRPWLTSSQIAAAIIVFIAGIALFTTALLYFRVHR